MRYLTVLIACLLAAPLQGAQTVVFGDSLSDGGYYGLRFTDPGGALWHEYLAADLGLDPATTTIFGFSGLNLAVGGSKVAGLQTQVDRYMGRHTWQAGDLCTLWSGGNDVRDNPGQNMNALALEVGSIIAQLAAQGVDHFVVPNLPDIGAIPEFAGDPAGSAARTTGTILFNAALAAEMDARAASLGVRIDQLDVFELFDAMLVYSADFGFSNVSEPLNAATGADPDEYAFWDEIHPTTRSHSLIATAARAIIDPAAPIELVSWSIQSDRSLRQTWLADPAASYEVLSGTDLNALSPAAIYSGSSAYITVVPAPGPLRGFYRTRRTAP